MCTISCSSAEMVPKECRIGARSDTAYRMGWVRFAKAMVLRSWPGRGWGRRSGAATAQGSRELPNAAARPHPTAFLLSSSSALRCSAVVNSRRARKRSFRMRRLPVSGGMDK